MTSATLTHPTPPSSLPSPSPAFSTARFGEPTAALPPLVDVIAYLEGTDPDSWWAGPTFRSPCGTRHCVLSHVEARWGAKAFDEFESTYATSYRIGAFVNDQPTEAYPQDHPKDRVLAFLRAMLAGDEMTTMESMDAEYAAYLADLMADRMPDSADAPWATSSNCSADA